MEKIYFMWENLPRSWAKEANSEGLVEIETKDVLLNHRHGMVVGNSQPVMHFPTTSSGIPGVLSPGWGFDQLFSSVGEMKVPEGCGV